LKKPVRILASISLLCALTVGISACSVEHNNALSKNYHNVLARYNGYFLAREKMKEVEASFIKSNIDNYDRVLDVFPLVTEAGSKGASAALEEIVKKASIPIQRHKNSQWVDDSYNLIGRARFYQQDYENAVQTFKYVISNQMAKEKNTPSEAKNGKDEMHTALIWLMRTYINTEEFDKVLAADEMLKKETLNGPNTRDWLLTRAHYFSKTKEYAKMEESLGYSIPYIIGREKRARIYYIIGQLRQLKGDESGAYASYNAVLINNPSYELSFYSKLNLAQVSELSAGNDVKRINRYFRKLLKDAKNVEYKDKIYYEMARFELKQDHVQEGISNLKKSVAVQPGNPNQKATSYLKLGEVYYSKLNDYTTAKNYYDSTLTLLDKNSENYKAVQQRQRVLEDFVKHYMVIQTEDSLQRLAALAPDALNDFLEKMIAREEMLRKEEEKRLAKAASGGGAGASVFAMEGGGGFKTDNASGSNWYFYNPAAVSRGRSEFARVWGTRPLEDNWRRSKKEKQASFENNQEGEGTLAGNKAGRGNETEAPAKEEGIDIEARKKELMAGIPATPDQIAVSNERLSEALYEVGRIYQQKLGEYENAATSYERLLKNHPGHENEVEVMYSLFLIYQKLNNPDSEKYKSRLLADYPNSVYTKKITNPNYAQESRRIAIVVSNYYKEAFVHYEKGEYDEAYRVIQNTLQSYPANEQEDKFIMLKALVTGKTQPVEAYRHSLEQFIATYNTSKLLPYANSLLQASTEFAQKQQLASQANQIADASKRVTAFDQPLPAQQGPPTQPMPAGMQPNATNGIPASGPAQAATPASTPTEEANTYTLDFDKPHFYIAVCKSQEATSSEAIKKFTDFHKKNFPGRKMQVNPQEIDGSSFAVIVKEFKNKDEAMSYMNIADLPQAPINDLGGSATAFLITPENYTLLMANKKIDEYIDFFRSNY
jgi:tetratricopeptide (TPR) repeat protein